MIESGVVYYLDNLSLAFGVVNCCHHIYFNLYLPILVQALHLFFHHVSQLQNNFIGII